MKFDQTKDIPKKKNRGNTIGQKIQTLFHDWHNPEEIVKLVSLHLYSKNILRMILEISFHERF